MISLLAHSESPPILPDAVDLRQYDKIADGDTALRNPQSIHCRRIPKYQDDNGNGQRDHGEPSITSRCPGDP